MNKSELIDAIAKRSDLSKVAARGVGSKVSAADFLKATLDIISEAIAAGDNVQLIGFGTFSVSERAARTGRNPQTGKAMKISAKKVVRFKAGNSLSEAANKPAATKSAKFRPGKMLRDSIK